MKKLIPFLFLLPLIAFGLGPVRVPTDQRVNGSVLVNGETAIDSKSIFEVRSTTKGSIAFPKMTTTQQNAIALPTEGSFLFDTTTHYPSYYNASGWLNVASLTGTETLTNKTISGASNTLSNVNLTSQVTGTLPTGNGGTGLATTGSAGQVLGTNGTTLAYRNSISAASLWDNCLITANIGASALTITLQGQSSSLSATNVCKIGMPASNGSADITTITANKTLVISSGSTLGHTSAVAHDIFVYYNGTDNSIGASSTLYDNGSRTTITEGGAGGADSLDPIYATTGSTTTIRLISVLNSTQATAGTYASTPSSREVILNDKLVRPTNVQTTTYTATQGDETILADATGGSWSLNLYTAVSNAGKTLTVIKTDSSANIITVDPSSTQTINGSTTFALVNQYGILRIVSDGANWIATQIHDPFWWDVSIAGANPSLGTGAQTAYVSVLDAGLTMTTNAGSLAAEIPCSTTVAPSGATCSSGSENVGIAITPPAGRGGYYEACIRFASNEADGVANGPPVFQVIQTASNAQTVVLQGGDRVQGGLNGNISSGNAMFPHPVCGIFSLTAGTKIALRLMYEKTASTNDVVVLADADANNGQRDVHITVKPIGANAL